MKTDKVRSQILKNTKEVLQRLEKMKNTSNLEAKDKNKFEIPKTRIEEL